MPVTALDLRTALVVIDLQLGLAAYPTVHPFDDVVANAARLAAAFRRARLPVVLVSVAFSLFVVFLFLARFFVLRPLVAGPDFSKLAPELGPAPDDNQNTKRQQN